MSRSFALVAVALLLLGGVRAAGAQTWSRTYEGPAGEGILALHEDGPGQLRAAAWTDSFGTGTADAWYLGIWNDGSVNFEHLFGETDAGGAEAAAFSRDGGALFAGRNVVDIFLKHDGWVLRTDDDGVLQWGTLIAWVGLGRVSLTAAVEASSGGWFVMGTSGMNDFPPQNTLMVRMDDLGAVLWRREHGSGAADTPRALAATDDGGLVMAGTTTSGGDEDALVVKFDFSGDVEWQRRYGGDGADEANDVVVVTSGGYAACGTTQSFTASGRAPWLQRFDDAGAITWQVVFGDREWGDLQALIETSDGALVALGRIAEPGFPTNDLWAVKVSAEDGSVIWERAYEGDSGDYADDLHELFDGSLLLGGTWGWGFPEEALWLMRTDSEGRLPGCDFVRDTALATSSPRLTEATGTLSDQLARPNTLPQSFSSETGGATERDRCAAAGCLPLSCDRLLAEPGPPCGPRTYTLEVETTGGEGALSIEWDVDGDGLPDATGSPVQLELPAGPQLVSVLVTDSCPDPEPQICELSEPVEVPSDPLPPAELSDVRAGEAPLLVLDRGALLVFEEDAAAAVNLHVGTIGSWYGPRPAGATQCHREDAVSGGDGTASLSVDLPADAWVVLSASDECFEGAAGADSRGQERSLAADWEICGPR